MSSLGKQYIDAMMSGNTDEAAQIEIDNRLYGHCPELVSIGLLAIDAGNCPHAAIDAYTGMRDDDHE